MIPHAQRRTYRFIKNYVTQHILSDNVPINVREIADILGVSPVPVRESLFRIAHDGLVDFLPEQGFFARNLSPLEIQHAYSIGGAIAVVGLDEARLLHQEAALVRLAVLAQRFHSKQNESARSVRTVQWIEAFFRQLIRVAYQRQPRWHLFRILDQTLAFRGFTSVDTETTARFERILTALAIHFASRDLEAITKGIGRLVEHEIDRLSVSYPIYSEAVAQARRYQNAAKGKVEGVLFTGKAAIVKIKDNGGRPPSETPGKKAGYEPSTLRRSCSTG